MNTSKAVGIWVRVSTDMQGDSPEHHLKRAEYYAEANGWEVKKIYQLEAVSGKSVIDRPEFKEMQADIKNRVITGLIFSKLARVARNTKELLTFADFIQDQHADMISLEEKLDTTTPMGRFFYTLIAAMAQWEREEIASRVAASVPIRAKLGKTLGGAAPFGYAWIGDKGKKHYIIDEKEAPVRKLMYEYFAKTKRKKTTAEMLNEQGYRTRSGHQFTDTTIDRLIRDPSAKGLRRANYTTGRNQKQYWVYKPTSEWIHLECPAIVSVALWNECNAYLDQQLKKHKRTGRVAKYLLAGYIQCECGKKMYVSTGSPSYACSICKTKIRIEDVDDIYRDELKEFLYADREGSDHQAHIQIQLQEKQALLETTGCEYRKLEADMQELVAMRVRKELNAEDFTRHYQPLKNRFEQLSNPLSQVQAQIDYLTIQAASAGAVIAEARDLYQRWPDMPFAEKRSIVEAITVQIVIGKETIKTKLANVPPAHTPSPQNGTNNQRDESHWFVVS